MEQGITIGGSEIAAVVGLNPWLTPLALWRRKVGLDEPQADNPSMAEGRAMEPVIAEEYREMTGATFLEIPPFSDPARPWRRASLDRLAQMPSGEVRVVEIKWSARGFGDEVPAPYYLQVQWYLDCYRLPRGDLVERRAGARPTIHTIEAAPDVQAWLLEEAEKFVLLCQNGMPPEPADDNERAQVALARVPSRGVTMRPDEALDLAVREVLVQKEYLRDVERKVKAVEAALLEAMAACGATRCESLSGWSCALVEREGAVRWKDVAEALGAREHPELLERYRGAGSRYLRWSTNKERNHG